MAAVRPPHPLRDHPHATRTAVDAFWVLAIGVIAAYAFFVMLGAFAPGDVTGLSIAVAILLVLCVARVVIARRYAGAAHRDPSAVHARERRGF
jgi:membrane protein implicated in regulation of membrane protease activity